MKIGKLEFILLLTCQFLGLPVVAAGWTSVSGFQANWVVAGLGSSLFAAGSSNIYGSSDSGKTWLPLNGPSGITALAFVNNQIWLGTSQQGLAYSANEGRSWNTSATGLINSATTLAPQINAIAANGNDLVVATQSGIYLSSNGASWTQPSFSNKSPITNNQPVYCLGVNAHGVLFAGSDTGVFRSPDSGKSWFAAGLTGIKITGISVIFSTVYAIGDAVYKSTDGGTTWTKLASLGATPVSVLAHPLRAGVVFLGSTQGSVSVSPDEGGTWSVISDGTIPATAINALAVPADQPDALVAATAGGVFRYVAPLDPKFSLAITQAIGVPRNAAIVSKKVIISGLRMSRTISTDGGQYSINGKAFTDQPGIVSNGARLRLLVNSPATPDTSTTATVTIGALQATFLVTTHKITRVADLTKVFPDSPSGAVINSDGTVTLSSPTPIRLNANLPSGAHIHAINGTTMTDSTGTMKFTAKTDEARLSVVDLTSTKTGTRVVSGTFSIETTARNSIPFTSGTLVTTDACPTTILMQNSGSQSSSFVQNCIAYFDASATAGQTNSLPSTAIAVYAGETVEVGSEGTLDRIRIGSLSGTQKLPGDPLTLPGINNDLANLDDSDDATVPYLLGNLQRLNGTASLVNVIQEGLNGKLGVTASQISYDSVNGVVTYTTGGKDYRFIPIDLPAVQTGNAIASGNRFAGDNTVSSASGAFSLSSHGIQLSMASSLRYFTDVSAALKSYDPASQVRLRSSGVMQLTMGGAAYICSPGSNVVGGGQTPSQQPGFQVDGNGVLSFNDSYGATQSLYPAFAEVSSIELMLKTFDDGASMTDNGNGTATVNLTGGSTLVKPEYPLLPVPSDHTSDPWWQEGAKIFLRYPDSTAQAMVF